PRPDLILLDLNLPKKNGREVLEEIKKEEALRHIPVVILTTSQAEQDVVESYRLQANAYVTKPVDLDQFLKVVSSIEQFWLEIVKLSRPSVALHPPRPWTCRSSRTTAPTSSSACLRRRARRSAPAYTR